MEETLLKKSFIKNSSKWAIQWVSIFADSFTAEFRLVPTSKSQASPSNLQVSRNSSKIRTTRGTKDYSSEKSYLFTPQ